MKRIGIDARLYFQTGVGVYIRNFLHYLQTYAPVNFEFYIYVMKKDASQIAFNSSQFVVKPVRAHWHSFAEQSQFYTTLLYDNLNLMHFTYFSYPVLYKKKFIATIHDVTPLVFKTGKASRLPAFLYEFKHWAFRYVLSQQVKNASIIITPTKAVKDQIVTLYGKKYENKITPIYEGMSYEFINASENQSLATIFTKPYFLYVGNFYPHKNVDMLVDAFHKMEEKKVELVLAGPDNYFSGKLAEKIRNDGVSGIRFYHPSNIQDLTYLYKHARALVNPSLSEGFGLPIVEASYFGTPVIASDLPVFHELLGNNYLSFNPESSSDIADKLSSFLTNPQTFDTAENLKHFSFKKMVQEYIAILKTHVNN